MMRFLNILGFLFLAVYVWEMIRVARSWRRK